jgi:hypothetical protein
MDNSVKASILCLLILGILLTVILVPLSFSYVEYYEYGLVREKATGTVEIDNVYSRGRYSLGVTKGFLKYQADAHYEKLEELSVFSSGGGNESIGLEFKIDVDFTFLLKKDEIGELHKEIASSYRSVIVSRAIDGIKNEAIFVSFNEYFQERNEVEARFRDAVQKRWDIHPSVHCNLDQFHLGRVRIPESVADKQLDSRIQNERNDREASLQKAALEREHTAVEVNSIYLEQDNTLRTARAEASLLTAKARAEAKHVTTMAEINGTKLLFEAVGIRDQDQMTSVTYIRTLANRDSLEMDVSYLTPDSVIRTRVA